MNNYASDICLNANKQSVINLGSLEQCNILNCPGTANAFFYRALLCVGGNECVVCSVSVHCTTVLTCTPQRVGAGDVMAVSGGINLMKPSKGEGSWIHTQFQRISEARGGNSSSSIFINVMVSRRTRLGIQSGQTSGWQCELVWAQWHAQTAKSELPGILSLIKALFIVIQNSHSVSLLRKAGVSEMGHLTPL